MSEGKLVNILDLLKTTTAKNTTGSYQIQSTKNSNSANIIYIGTYDNPPVQHIHTLIHPLFNNVSCEIISALVPYCNLSYDTFTMISMIISVDDNVAASLEYCFRPTTEINKMNELSCKNVHVSDKQNKYDVNGTFEIILRYKKNEIYKSNIIKKYVEYIGSEDSIYLLTSILLEEDVVEKYIRKKEH